MIVLILIIIVFIIITYKINKKLSEKFITGEGRSFAEFINPIPQCNINNDCFPGYYFRSQIYQNMCEPRDLGPLKNKTQLIDSCVRTLEFN